MTQMSGTLANAQAASIAATFADGFLDLYSGTPGATPEDVSGAVLCASIKLPMAPFAAPAGGALALAGQWFGTCTTPGTLTFGRFRDPNATLFLVVSVSATGGGGEVTMASPVIALNDVIEITAFSYTVPAGP
jgi:hypothetical protein